MVGLAGVCSLIYLVWFSDPAIYLLNDCMFIHSFIKPASSSVLCAQDTAVINQSISVLQHKKMNTDYFMFCEGSKGGVIGVCNFRVGKSRHYLK